MDGNVPFSYSEDELFRAQATDLGISPKELDEKLLDITFIIARIPLKFPKLRNTNIYRAVYDGSPRLRIWFSFDGKTLVLKSLETYGPNEI